MTTDVTALAWSCLQCLDHGAGPTSNRDAEKHTKATGHGTTVHLDKPWWSEAGET